MLDYVFRDQSNKTQINMKPFTRVLESLQDLLAEQMNPQIHYQGNPARIVPLRALPRCLESFRIRLENSRPSFSVETSIVLSGSCREQQNRLIIGLY